MKRHLIKRRAILAAAAAVAFTAALPFGTAVSFAADVTLRVHHFLPPQANIPKYAIQAWADKVEKDSDGRIDVEVFPAMQLGGKPPALYQQVQDGVVDVAWTVIGYTPGRFPKTEAFELPFMTGNAEKGSRAFHQYVTEQGPEEFKDIKPLAFHVHGPGVIHSSKPVSTVADMKGLKVRGPTRVINNLLAKTGAAPVGMPVPAIPEGLQKGVIDAAVIPFEVAPALKVPELVSNHTGFASDPGLYTATFVFGMNQAKYDALPDDLKKVIDANSGPDLAAAFGKVMDEGDVPGKEAASKNNVVMIEDRAEWEKVGEEVTKDWIAEANGKGLDGEALVKAAKDAIAAQE